MEKFQSLADYLGVEGAPSGGQPAKPVTHLEDIAGDAKAFCDAVLNSFEFRQYIVHGLILGSIPAAVMIRVMDMAGWQKPPERHEVTGRDGQPIETITEVRRVIVRVPPQSEETSSDSYTTH